MDESDYFLREFVKARNQSHLNKVKLKKVVSDILLAQKVRRFLLSVQGDSKQTTRRPETRGRLSVRVVSPRRIITPKHSVSHKNTIFKNKLSMPEIKVPVKHVDKTKKSAGSGSKTPVATFSVSSAKHDKAQRESSGKHLWPRLLDGRNESVSSQDVPPKSSSAKMPKIENKSASKLGRCVSLSPPKTSKNPLVRLALNDKILIKNSASEDKTSLPALSEHLWAGDPNAIASVRRPRKNAREMLASYKSGEETRRLFRQMTVTCSRNCHKPDLFSDMERMYTELPSLLPAIEKAREDMGMEKETSSINSAHSRSRDRKPSVNLLTLHSQTPSRRNSIAASNVSGRRTPTQFQQTALRHHGTGLRQITTGHGFRH